MAQKVVNEAAATNFTIQAAPGATSRHQLTGFILSTDTAGIVTIADIPIRLPANGGISVVELPEVRDLAANTALTVNHSAAGSVRGVVYWRTGKV